MAGSLPSAAHRCTSAGSAASSPIRRRLLGMGASLRPGSRQAVRQYPAYGGLMVPETPEVCVVGGGPAGLTTALTLGAAGRSVVLLESGGFDGPAAAQELNDGDHEGEPYDGLGATRHRQIG